MNPKAKALQKATLVMTKKPVPAKPTLVLTPKPPPTIRAIPLNTLA